MRILLIWEEVGTDLKLYNIQEEKDAERICSLHGEWVNGGMDPLDESWIEEYLNDKVPFYIATEGGPVYPPYQHFDRIVVTGVM